MRTRSLVLLVYAATLAPIACAHGDPSSQGSAIQSGDEPGGTEPDDTGHASKPDSHADVLAHDTSATDASGPKGTDAGFDSTIDTIPPSDAPGTDGAVADAGFDGGIDTAVAVVDSGVIAIDSGSDSGVIATDSGSDSGATISDASTDAGPPLTATWSTTAEAHRCLVGSAFVYACPAGGPLGRAWGTGEYTDDSSICTAAVHEGKLDMIAGGAITIEMRAGAASYTGSTANGVTTSDWTSWTCSFAVK